MSGPAVVAYLLSQNAPVVAAVPAARIFAAPELPMGTALPAISVWSVSRAERLTVGMSESSRFQVERVQVMVHAKTEPSKDSILALVRAALPVSRGTVNGVKVDSILPDLVGPDLSQPDAGIYEQSRDFMVKWSS